MRMDLAPQIGELLDEDMRERVKAYLDERTKAQYPINHANLCSKIVREFNIKHSTASAAIAAWNIYLL